MTKSQAVERMFRAYGSLQPDRLAIYVEDLEQHPARWTDLEVEAGCTRARQRWKHASLPPIGAVIAGCHEIREEDQRTERATSQRRALSIDPEWIAENEREHVKLMRELFAAGLDYCDVSKRWVPAGEAKHLPPDHPRYSPVAFATSRAAVLELRAGRLAGNATMAAARENGRLEFQRMKRREVRGQRRRDRRGEPERVTAAMAEVFD